MFEGLHSQGQQTEVRDWVLLSLGSFIQRFVPFVVVIIALSGLLLKSHSSLGGRATRGEALRYCIKADVTTKET